jgi:hypothetical protein
MISPKYEILGETCPTEGGKYYAIIVVSNSQLSIEIRHFRLKTSHPISSWLTIINFDLLKTHGQAVELGVPGVY